MHVYCVYVLLLVWCVLWLIPPTSLLFIGNNTYACTCTCQLYFLSFLHSLLLSVRPSIPLSNPLSSPQQVADQTGEVQYATQTVTVTERDAKALGQPVGSTTTVLLTAYPGGHSGGVESASDSSQQFLSPPSTTANVPNVQVMLHVLSASLPTMHLYMDMYMYVYKCMCT